MRSASAPPMRRVQSSLSAAQWNALAREAKVRGLSLSQVASEAMARGLRRSPQADPDDRLLRLERRLSDHMRLSARDLQIIEELQFAIARLMFTRLPETELDHDPLAKAAVEARLKRLLDDVASRIGASQPSAEGLDPGGELPAAVGSDAVALSRPTPSASDLIAAPSANP